MQRLIFFRKFAFFTLVAVYILILLGATVRASGSGMGCPDWPTCFGRIIPPISASQLPENYQELYAPKLASGELLEEFNVQKTWTEYLNRLFGVFVGLLSILLVLFSFSLRKKARSIFRLSLTIFILICLQGGLGAIVVATNLLPGMISAHMFMALVIVCLLIYLIFNTRQIIADYEDDLYQQLLHRHEMTRPRLAFVYRLSLFVFIIMLVQMLMGTQVREMIDFANKTTDTRGDWIALLGDLFYVHRSFSWVIVVANSILLWTIYKYSRYSHFFHLQFWASLLILMQVFTGSLLNHFSFPIVIQPLHLLVSTIILGIQFALVCYLKMHYKKNLLVSSFT